MLLINISIRLFIIVFSSLILVSCKKDAPLNATNDMIINTPTTPAVQKDSTIKQYLALGDSYTIGQDVAEAGRFPMQVVSQLREANINITNPIYIATTGWTTTNLMNAINATALKPPYDVVSLLIGVNDQYQIRDTTGYRERFTALLKKAVELAGNKPGRVFVLSIPDYSVTPFVSPADKETISKQIDEFNFINRQVTEQQNIAYTNITPSSRQAKSDATLIAGDGLHPSEKEYKKWADMLLPQFKKVLQ